MSHFALMVIQTGKNTQKPLDEVLQPFHEFECTGIEDEYVQDVDLTEKIIGEYETAESQQFRDPDGKLHSPYDDRFYREPTPEEAKIVGLGTGTSGSIMWRSKDWGDGRGYRAKVHFVPKGWADVQVPVKELQTLLDYASGYHEYKVVKFGEKPDITSDAYHKFGYTQLNAKGEVEKIVRRTNPNKKWDWWVLGGRWTGFLKLKPGAHGLTGKPGLMVDRAPAGYADHARARDVDFDQMIADKEVKARALWKLVREKTGGQAWESWDDMRERYKGDIERARAEYHDQPALVMVKEAKIKLLEWEIDDDLALDEDKYVDIQGKKSITTFAYLLDGAWHERGEMLMFATVADEMSTGQWHSKFHAMIQSLPEDALISIVDCHI